MRRGSLASLSTLNLQSNKMDVFPRSVLGLSSLTTLNLYDNRIRMVPQGLAEGLPRLTSLSINSNQLDSFPSHLPPSLVDLNIHSNPLRALHLPPSVRHIQVLNVGNCGLRELPPEIGKMVALRKLYAGDNKLTRLPVELLELRKTLDTIRVRIIHGIGRRRRD